MDRRSLLLAIAFATCAPAFAAEETPRDIVAKLYRLSAGKNGPSYLPFLPAEMR